MVCTPLYADMASTSLGLYGHVMSLNLSTSGFRWVKNPEKFKGSISKLANKGIKGYLLEMDISYCCNLHDLHNDLPFMCKKMKIHGIQKLVSNLFHKKKHVIHIAALNQALKHGLVLQCVQRAIKFDQSAWLALYITFNTQLRTRVKNDFEKASSSS